METGCGNGNRTASGILDLEIGMTADQARQVLSCYDSSALVLNGTSGRYQNDLDRYLKEIDPEGSGYNNLHVWTRGEERDCGGSGGDNSSQLAENLQPDDRRLAPFVFSATQFPGWNHCLSRVKDQIVLRFGGPPDAMVVIGIWRLSVPRDGHRPRLADLASQLNARYPLLAIDRSRIGDDGLTFAVFTNAQGERLDAEQISRDFNGLTPPTPPQPPATTESCGILSSCPRTPPQSEIDAYQAQLAAHGEAMRIHNERRNAADAFGRCVTNPPLTTGHAPLDETDQAQCGPSLVVAARPYPGGFVEAYFVGIYSQKAAAEARTRLDEYVRNRRGQRPAAAGSSRPPV